MPQRHHIAEIILILLLVYTWLAYPRNDAKGSLEYIWYCGWLTAMSTGLGALPFYVVDTVSNKCLGTSNAIAAGMMVAAGCTLVHEGVTCTKHLADGIKFVVLGVLLGVVFIKGTKMILDKYDTIQIGQLEGLNAKKALLIMTVMTLHSMSEGIGIGVSFGGDSGGKRGVVVATTLAIHNIPEGLAISLVLIPKGVSVSYAALWAIVSSIPQPIFAVPSYMFVTYFQPLLPIGLGFAAGAMAFVAIFELIPEAVEHMNSKIKANWIMLMAFTIMIRIQIGLAQ